MRLGSLVAVLCASLAVVAGGVAAPMGARRLAAAARVATSGPRVARGVVSRSCAVSARAGTKRGGAGAGGVVLGVRSVGPVVGQGAAGVAHGFVVWGRASGTVAAVSVFVGSGSRARRLMVGVYSATGCRADVRLTSGSLVGPRAGAWNRVLVRPVLIQAGRMYWLVLLGRGGVLRFREPRADRCASAGSQLANLTSPPLSWKAGAVSDGCGVSAYAVAAATIQHGTLSGAPVGGSTPVATVTATTTTAGTGSGSGSGTGTGTGTGGIPDPLAPTAAFTVSPDPTIGQPVTFDGSGSTCVVGPCTYAWDDDGGEPPTGDWPLGTGQVLKYTFTGSAFTAYVRLTVTDALGQTGTVEHTVNVAAAPPPAPVNSVVPSVGGTAQVGDQLTASPGTWSGSPSYAYAWSDCNSSGSGCSSISGATGSAYTVPSSDVGQTIEVTVTATNASGSASATSGPSAVVTIGSGGGSSCTETVGSATVLTSAVSSAAGGSTICVASGSYGTMTWSGGTSRTSQVTVQPAPGATVTFTGMLTEDASNLHVLDINMAGQLWEIDGPTSNVTMEGITAAHFRILSSASGGASDITLKGGSYGPNHAYPDNTIGSNASTVNTNITIDGVLFHDQTLDATDFNAGEHMECLQVWDANGLTIENSKFTNCEYFDLFLQHVAGCPGSGNCPSTPTNITIQNNWFDCCTSFRTGANSYYKNFAVMFATDHGEGQWSNVAFRNNSGDGSVDLGTNQADAQTWSSFRIENNALPQIDDWQDTCSNCVPSGVTEQYNAWFQGSSSITNGTGHDIGTTNPTSIFTNWEGGENADGNQDFHELTGSPTVKAGDPNYYPPTDIDGNTRTSPPDIGAS